MVLYYRAVTPRRIYRFLGVSFCASLLSTQRPLAQVVPLVLIPPLTLVVGAAAAGMLTNIHTMNMNCIDTTTGNTNQTKFGRNVLFVCSLWFWHGMYRCCGDVDQRHSFFHCVHRISHCCAILLGHSGVVNFSIILWTVKHDSNFLFVSICTVYLLIL